MDVENVDMTASVEKANPATSNGDPKAKQVLHLYFPISVIINAY